MIEFWERFVVFREKAITQKDKLYELVMTRIDICCDICFAPMQNNHEIVRHVKTYHQDLINGGDPDNRAYKTFPIKAHQMLLKQDICPIGCGYWYKQSGVLHDDMVKMGEHMILFHSLK